jgi:hypothetical protein
MLLLIHQDGALEYAGRYYPALKAMLQSFSQLSPDSRLWVFASDRDLTPAEVQTVNSAMTGFLVDWKAHGAAVEAGFELQHNRFLLIASSNAMADPSGCSIDNMTRTVRELGQQLGVSFMPGANIFYQAEDSVRMTDRPTFKELAKKGLVGQETTVFNTNLTSVEELKAGKWKLRAGESWHKQLLGS